MSSDYQRIAAAIEFINSQVERQPVLDEIAAHLHLSPCHFQRLFTRWAGVTPKRYLQLLTVEHAKRLLAESKPLLEVSEAVGLSSGSRLHDHFVQLEAVTPGEYKKRGEGLTIDYGLHATPFGNLFIASTPRGVCKLDFIDEDIAECCVTLLHQQWPNASLTENREATRRIVDAMFDNNRRPERPLSLYVSGTNFQVNVWRALLQIPPGAVTSYSQLARIVGRPRAARAVGSAVGANPIAFLIPCHRVIRQSGQFGDYRWGRSRKQAMQLWEQLPKK